MIRLSRRGWNNVLIFATLLLILLFNQSGKFLSDPTSTDTMHLLPADIPVMKIEFGSHLLERVGQGWRLRRSENADEPSLTAIVQNWQAAEPISLGEGSLATGVVVVVWLAGEEQGRVFSLQQRDDGVLVAHQGKLYQLPNAYLASYLPEGTY
ncbi:hypothetical protein KJY73_19580 [Bowmanella sp. Y26]|uniref:hypothetical protein n=1 Tax=Bowmanella yangjiangensis TaxID=2811230 RepID=UPI001BDD1F7B|nr:hypothetical protein [Bowmanella yangjiangensis]MBT1065783.1 hypothetical protein [Bowmanella yangjiangensis]